MCGCLHFAGSSNYRSFEQPMNTTSSNGVDGVYIIEVAYIDTQGGGSKSLLQTNFLDSFKVALFGVPDDRYKYMSDGVVYNNYTSMMNHVETLAKEHGQTGPLPVVWHGTVRSRQPTYRSWMWIPTVLPDNDKNLWDNSSICIDGIRSDIPILKQSLLDI